ncbi:glutaredoxin-like protein [Perilla frutescens var. hirtella]|nr:glutaredoxin-like protein [Perilla frutescens var. hirtella]
MSAILKSYASDDRLHLDYIGINNSEEFRRASPSIRFFKSKGIESELRNAAREYFQRDDGMQIDLAKRTVYIADFGQEKEIPEWMIKHLDASKAGLLTPHE